MATSSAKNSGTRGFKATTARSANKFGPNSYGAAQARVSSPGYSWSQSTSDGNNGVAGVLYEQMTITGSTTLTVEESGFVELLMAGGGGGANGGNPDYPSGGGGAGGVYYRLGTPLEKGTYNVTVGSGSTGTGGDTSITGPTGYVMCGGGGVGGGGPGSYGPVGYNNNGRPGSGGGGRGGHGTWNRNPGRGTGPGISNIRYYYGGTATIAGIGGTGGGTGNRSGGNASGGNGVVILRRVAELPDEP